MPPIELRPLRRADFPLVGRWLREPVVARWWATDASPTGVEKEFGAAVDGREPTEVFVASEAGAAFGLVQRYLVESYDDYRTELAGVCDLPPGAFSIDYLIGEPGRRGRGLGAALIATTVALSWQRWPDAPAVIVPVAAGNVASWRALERAGLTRVAEGELTPDNPIDPPWHVIYRQDRP